MLKDKQIAKYLVVILFLCIFSVTISGEQTLSMHPSLDAIFDKGGLLVDSNGDGLPDDVNVRILITKDAEPGDIEAASAIAARLGFESVALNLPITTKSWKEAKESRVDWLILFRRTPHENKKKQNCGIKTYRETGINVIEIYGPTDKARRYAALNFFSRYPYIWEVIGREQGELWSHLKRDIDKILSEENSRNISTSLSEIKYSFRPPLPPTVQKRRLESLGLENTLHQKGEVDNIVFEISTKDNPVEILPKFLSIKQKHSGGVATNLLNFSGLSRITLRINGKAAKRETLIIPRVALSQRHLNRVTDASVFAKKTKPKSVNQDIATFFSNHGIYRDTNKDKISDKLNSHIIFDNYLPSGAIDLSARIGLDGCGLTLPFIKNAKDFTKDDLKFFPTPVLVSSGNRFVDYLVKTGKAKINPTREETSFIHYSQGFNPSGTYIISGSSPDAENRAFSYVAKVLPYINSTEKGAPEWSDLSKEIHRFFSRQSDAGMATWATVNLLKSKQELLAPDFESAKGEIYTSRKVKNLQSFIVRKLSGQGSMKRNTSGKKLEIHAGGRLEGKESFTQIYEPEWEVEKFRNEFTRQVMTKLRNIARKEAMRQAMSEEPRLSHDQERGLVIDLRLSEPRGVLKNIEKWVQQQATRTGIDPKLIKVRSICAYKQGFHWLKDFIIPHLKNRGIKKIEIRFAPSEPDFSETRKYWEEPVRWLQELYPIDEVFAREIDIPIGSINFIKDGTLKNAKYRVTALGDKGSVLFQEDFSPFLEEIPFFNRFPGWGNVKVSTGGLSVKWNGQEIHHVKIDTDPLKLWKHYQQEILPKITKQIEKEAGTPLKMEQQPFFDSLQVEVWMSEPDYRLGIDEEIVSSLESFHEDLYLNTLEYFSGLVKKTKASKQTDPRMAGRWAAPGNILPIVHPSRTGSKPTMKTVFTSLESPSAKFKMTLKYSSLKKPITISKKIQPLKIKKPKLITVFITKEGKADSAVYEVLFENEQQLAEAAYSLRILEDMQTEGVLKSEFSRYGLSELVFQLRTTKLETDFKLKFKKTHAPDQRNITKPITEKFFNRAISSVMGHDLVLSISKQLGETFPEIDNYISGRSFQGRAMPVLEVGLPQKGKYISRAKLITHKPTIFILGRQHANEVSSTNYGLKLAWLLAKDPAFRKYLKNLNIIIEPMENPDGSEIALKLHKLTPNHMLHAGRYSALGTDIGYHVNNPDSLITEARVRKMIYDRWLPDIFLNNHGYPSHEWVQQFSNYTPYKFRAYWAPRGWYYFHVGLNDIGHPFHKTAGEKIVKTISRKMKGDKEIFETNRRIYERYKRWAARWQPHLHYLEIYDGTNIYKDRRRGRAAKESPRRKLTVLEAIPEAMDETARGDWLGLAIRQGVLFITSFMDLLIEAEKPIERIEEEYNNAVHLQIIRHRPIRF